MVDEEDTGGDDDCIDYDAVDVCDDDGGDTSVLAVVLSPWI